jgi:hypothetical protein
MKEIKEFLKPFSAINDLITIEMVLRNFVLSSWWSILTLLLH